MSSPRKRRKLGPDPSAAAAMAAHADPVAIGGLMGTCEWDTATTVAWVEVAKLLTRYSNPSDQKLEVVREILRRTRMTEELSRRWVDVAVALAKYSSPSSGVLRMILDIRAQARAGAWSDVVRRLGFYCDPSRGVIDTIRLISM